MKILRKIIFLFVICFLFYFVTGTSANPNIQGGGGKSIEIFADDVKAAHGCAVGELDADGLFYLMSRGLPPAEAKRLMLQAFIAEAFTGAPGEEALSKAALARLGALVETGL